jgi:chromosome segregation ATPase
VNQRAKVTSIDALREFRAMLNVYQDAVRDAAEMLALEARRGVAWVDERPNFWQSRSRRLEEDLVAAKAALEQAMCRHLGDTPASCIDEKKAINRIKAQLEDARRKVKVARGWKVSIDREQGEFETRIHHLNDYADIDLPKAIAALERMITSLDKYAAKSDGVGGAQAALRPTSSGEGLGAASTDSSSAATIDIPSSESAP